MQLNIRIYHVFLWQIWWFSFFGEWWWGTFRPKMEKGGYIVGWWRKGPEEERRGGEVFLHWGQQKEAENAPALQNSPFPSLPDSTKKRIERVSGQKVSARHGLFFFVATIFLALLRTVVVQLFSYREGTPDKNATRQKNTKRTGNKRGNNDFPLFCANICVGERGGVGWLVPFHDCCCAGISFTENAARPPTPPPPIKNGKKACCRAANWQSRSPREAPTSWLG